MLFVAERVLTAYNYGSHAGTELVLLVQKFFCIVEKLHQSLNITVSPWNSVKRVHVPILLALQHFTGFLLKADLDVLRVMGRAESCYFLLDLLPLLCPLKPL